MTIKQSKGLIVIERLQSAKDCFFIITKPINTIIYFLFRSIKKFLTPKMITFTRITLLICVFVFSCVITKAQHTNDSTVKTNSIDTAAVIDSLLKELQKEGLLLVPKKSYLAAGLSFLNNNVYLGRKDSVNIPYITPDMAYYFKSGFYIESSLSYVISFAQNRIDAGTFSGGYNFISKNYIGEVTASKFFYSSQSTNVKSEVKGSLDYYNSYNFGFITPTVTATLDFGTKTDIVGEFGIEHSFGAFKDKLYITPTLTANASTQNYYNNYYRKRRYTIKRKGKPPIIGIAKVTGIVEDASTFKLLDYEISVPFEYQTGKFIFTFNPVYAIPVNPAIVQITTVKQNNTSTTRTAIEKIGNTFYGTVGVIYKFGK